MTEKAGRHLPHCRTPAPEVTALAITPLPPTSLKLGGNWEVAVTLFQTQSFIMYHYKPMAELYIFCSSHGAWFSPLYTQHILLPLMGYGSQFLNVSRDLANKMETLARTLRVTMVLRIQHQEARKIVSC